MVPALSWGQAGKLTVKASLQRVHRGQSTAGSQRWREPLHPRHGRWWECEEPRQLLTGEAVRWVSGWGVVQAKGRGCCRPRDRAAMARKPGSLSLGEDVSVASFQQDNFLQSQVCRRHHPCLYLLSNGTLTRDQVTTRSHSLVSSSFADDRALSPALCG